MTLVFDFNLLVLANNTAVIIHLPGSISNHHLYLVLDHRKLEFMLKLSNAHSNLAERVIITSD